MISLLSAPRTRVRTLATAAVALRATVTDGAASETGFSPGESVDMADGEAGGGSEVCGDGVDRVGIV